MLVSIVVPAYKKERTILKDIKNIYSVMNSTRYKFEIIVVVDGILDRTFDKAKTFLKKNVRVYCYKENRGKGYAVRYGMARSRGDPIAFIDSGMEIDANGISMILEHMQWYKADIIVGSKRHPASKVDFPLLRRFYSLGYQLIVLFLFWFKIRDTQTGLKVYSRKVIRDILPRLTVIGYAFDVEMLTVAHHLGYTRIYEAPVTVSFDFRESRFKYFLFFDPFIRSFLVDTLSIFYRMNFLSYYDSKNKRKWNRDKDLVLKI